MLNVKPGASIVCPLPDHKDTDPSFKVYGGDKGWHCYGCTRGGSVIDYVMYRDGIDHTAAIRKLADTLGIKVGYDVPEVTLVDYPRSPTHNTHNPQNPGSEGIEGSVPTPLSRAARPRPLPADALPAPFNEYAQALAESLQVPVDLPVVLVLAVIATAVAGRAQVKIRDGWTEPLNIFTAAILSPGERKSPAFRAATAPLTAVETDLVKADRPRQAEHKMRAEVLTKRARRAADEAVKAEGAERVMAVQAAIEAEQELEEYHVPPAPRLIVDDVTPEVLATLLVDHGRIGMLSSEGGVFGILNGRYSTDPNLDPFLKGWSGDTLRVDRRDRSEHVDRPALTVALTVQPEVIRQAMTNEAIVGRGLLARFLLVQPDSTVGTRAVDPPGVPETVEAGYFLAAGSLTRWGAAQTQTATLTFTDPARKRLMVYAKEIEARLGDDGDLGHLGGWGGKLVGTVARIAGLIHVAGHPEQPDTIPLIPVAAVDAAIELGEAFTTHAIAIADDAGLHPTVAGARKIARWMTSRTDPDQPFTRREVHQDLRARFATVDDLLPCLDLLIHKSWLIHHRTPPPTDQGGRPSDIYTPHPEAGAAT